jgi:hypothetical protein
MITEINVWKDCKNEYVCKEIIRKIFVFRASVYNNYEIVEVIVFDDVTKFYLVAPKKKKVYFKRLKC